MVAQTCAAGTLVLVCASVAVSAQAVRDTSYTATTTERVLRFESDVAASIDDVWRVLTTSEGLSRWLASEVSVDFTVGGSVTPRDTASGRIGDSGAAALDIVNYLEKELVTFRISLDDRFSETIRGEDDHLQEIVRLVPLGDNRTRVISSMVGWGDSRIWTDAYAFFRQRHQESYARLVSTFAAGRQ